MFLHWYTGRTPMLRQEPVRPRRAQERWRIRNLWRGEGYV
jgi:hypothetical protein